MPSADPPAQQCADAEYNKRWLNIWDSGLEAGKCFDASKASPALLALLDGGLDVKGKRVLVPGCGRGYDVAVLASRGAKAVGLELSDSAVRAAQQEIAQSNLGANAADSRCVQGDFFEYQYSEGPFDLGYDYTFLCALHPSMRARWAPAWARLLRPGGELVTLMFPLPPAAGDGGAAAPEAGPPWPLTPQLYRDLLLNSGFKEVGVEAVPPEHSHPGREGREMLGRWQRL